MGHILSSVCFCQALHTLFQRPAVKSCTVLQEVNLEIGALGSRVQKIQKLPRAGCSWLYAPGCQAQPTTSPMFSKLNLLHPGSRAPGIRRDLPHMDVRGLDPLEGRITQLARPASLIILVFREALLSSVPSSPALTMTNSVSEQCRECASSFLLA